MMTPSDKEEKFIEIMVYLEEYTKAAGGKNLKANSTVYSASVVGLTAVGNTFSIIAVAKVLGDGTYDVSLRPEIPYVPKSDVVEARAFAQGVIESISEAVKEIVAR